MKITFIESTCAIFRFDELWDLMMPGFPGKTITIHNQESADGKRIFFIPELAVFPICILK